MKRRLILLPAAVLLLTACNTAGSSSAGSSTAEPSGTESSTAEAVTDPSGYIGKWIPKESGDGAGFIFEGMLGQPEIPVSYLVQIELRENGEAYFNYPLFGYDDTMHWSSFADAMRRNGLDPDHPESWAGVLSTDEAEMAEQSLKNNAITVFRSETNWITSGDRYALAPDAPGMMCILGREEETVFVRTEEFPEVPADVTALYRIVQHMQGTWGCTDDRSLAMNVTGCTAAVYAGSAEPAETLQLRRQPDNTFLLENGGNAAGTLAFLNGTLIRSTADGTSQVFEMISEDAFREIISGEDTADEE